MYFLKKNCGIIHFFERSKLRKLILREFQVTKMYNSLKNRAKIHFCKSRSFSPEAKSFLSPKASSQQPATSSQQPAAKSQKQHTRKKGDLDI